MNRSVKTELEGICDRYEILRYVDDYLVVVQDGVQAQRFIDIFRANQYGFKFEVERAAEGKIQFLELELSGIGTSLCYGFRQRSAKALLPYSSGHSKLIKRGLVSNLIEQVSRKSCEHRVHEALRFQLTRLSSAGFPHDLIQDVATQLMLKHSNESSTTNRRSYDGSAAVTIPYTHGASHLIKRVAEVYGVGVRFSFPGKLASLPSKVNSEVRIDNCDYCGGSRCEKGVIYKIPCECGGGYYGQTGRCLLQRIHEHENLYDQQELDEGRSNLRDHRRDCPGTVLFDRARILMSNKNRSKRETLEAFFIEENKSNSIASPSVVLRQVELLALRKAYPGNHLD
jgi:hypothetical protein